MRSGYTRWIYSKWTMFAWITFEMHSQAVWQKNRETGNSIFKKKEIFKKEKDK